MRFVIIPITAILMPAILVSTIVLGKFRHQRGLLRHEERMRAIELGMSPYGSGTRIGAGTVIAIGAGVPIAAVLGALITTSSVRPSHGDFTEILAITWGCAFLISATALVASVILGILVLRASQRESSAIQELEASKPVYDPDAYDVVSRRG